MVPVVDDNFPEKSSAIGKNKVHKPTFKGVGYVAVNFALLSLRDTRPDQYPRPRRRADAGPGYHKQPIEALPQPGIME